MSKTRVLFVCIHNSARSQIAEELLRKTGGDRFQTESAGIEPGVLNPYVVRVLKEDEGIDITGKKTQAVFDLFKAGRSYHYVIAVCDREAAERCPIFPGVSQRILWSFPDPSKFVGSDEERLARVRAVKDQIQAKLQEWIATLG